MELKPSFVSLIDENNRPLLVHVVQGANESVNNELKFNAFSNMALDYFESDLYEWISISQDCPDIKNLFQLEGVCVYGKLIRQTSLKIVIGFSSDLQQKDKDILSAFDKVSKLYLRCKCNPFVNNSEDLIAQLERKFEESFKNTN